VLTSGRTHTFPSTDTDLPPKSALLGCDAGMSNLLHRATSERSADTFITRRQQNKEKPEEKRQKIDRQKATNAMTNNTNNNNDAAVNCLNSGNQKERKKTLKIGDCGKN